MKKHYKLIVGGVLIFISGLLIGGGVAHLIAAQKKKIDPLHKFRADAFKMMVKELKLTPEQQLQVGIFLDKAIVRMKTFRLKHTPEILMIIKENHQDLAKLLTPEQWKIYEGYRNEKLDKIQKDIP